MSDNVSGITYDILVLVYFTPCNKYFILRICPHPEQWAAIMLWRLGND